MYRALPLGLCLVALAGCQSAGSNLSRLEIRPVETGAVTGDQALALATGKAQLARGDVMAAMASFRQVLRQPGNPGEVAEAHNGLGAAYARLEQHEAAQRHFQRATEADPGNPKFARNLARAHLQALRTPSRSADPDEARAAADRDRALVHLQTQFDAVLQAPRRVLASLPNARSAVMTRLSRHEISITTASEADRKTGNGQGTAMAYADDARPLKEQVPYPIRIDLTKLPAR